MAAASAEPDIADWPWMQGVPAGRKLFDWAADDSGARPRLCLLRGADGTGKTRHLEWFADGPADQPRTAVHATVPAAGLIADTFAWELGRRLGYGPLAPEALLERVAADERPLLVVVLDLHRAGRGAADRPEAEPATLVAEVLLPLLRLPRVRAMVEVGDSGLLAGEPAEAVTVPGRRPEGPAPDAVPGGAFKELLDSVPRTRDGRPDWERAPGPLREQLLDQAVREGAGRPGPQVQALLTDPGFLVHGPAAAITAVVRDTRTRLPRGLRETWRRAAPQLTGDAYDGTERGALLHAAAVGGDPRLGEYLRPLAERNPWHAVWARPGTPVAALAALPGADGLLLAADPEGRLASCAGATGASAAAPADQPLPRPRALVAHADGSALLLDGGGTLHPLAGRRPGGSADDALARIAAYHAPGAVTALGGAPRADGASTDVVVADAEGGVHLWHPTTGAAGTGAGTGAAPVTHRPHASPSTAVTCVHVPAEGLTLVFSAARDGSVRLWETARGPMPDPVERRSAQVTALACVDTTEGPLLAVAWSDSRLHLWHVLSGRMRAVPLLQPCSALAFTADGLLAAGGGGGLHALRIDSPAP